MSNESHESDSFPSLADAHREPPTAPDGLLVVWPSTSAIWVSCPWCFGKHHPLVSDALALVRGHRSRAYYWFIFACTTEGRTCGYEFVVRIHKLGPVFIEGISEE